MSTRAILAHRPLAVTRPAPAWETVRTGTDDGLCRNQARRDPVLSPLWARLEGIHRGWRRACHMRLAHPMFMSEWHQSPGLASGVSR